jgi:hypothetical protein
MIEGTGGPESGAMAAGLADHVWSMAGMVHHASRATLLGYRAEFIESVLPPGLFQKSYAPATLLPPIGVCLSYRRVRFCRNRRRENRLQDAKFLGKPTFAIHLSKILSS